MGIRQVGKDDRSGSRLSRIGRLAPGSPELEWLRTSPTVVADGQTGLIDDRGGRLTTTFIGERVTMLTPNAQNGPK